VAHLLAIVIVVGLVDSANPSTIAPALYFATGKTASTSLFGFIAGVVTTNLVAGVLLVVGPGEALTAAIPRPGDEARHLIELAAGAATLALAAGLWHGRRAIAGHVSRTTARVDRSSLLVGAGIMIVELPTALPYFAVIATIVGSERPLPTEIVLLVIFDVVFALPLLAILAARAVAGKRAERWLERLRGRLEARLAILVPALVLVIAVALIATGTYGVLTD
jgi:cytochrome c biogenesis protein CcdA